MKEDYSPSDYKQNTWEYDEDNAYNTYTRVYIWDLDEPLSREEFEKALKENKNFTRVWGPRKNK